MGSRLRNIRWIQWEVNWFQAPYQNDLMKTANLVENEAQQSLVSC